MLGLESLCLFGWRKKQNNWSVLSIEQIEGKSVELGGIMLLGLLLQQSTHNLLSAVRQKSISQKIVLNLKESVSPRWCFVSRKAETSLIVQRTK